MGIVPLITGWIVLICANSVVMIYAARVLWGATLGMAHSVVLPMYLGEISSDRVRGAVSTIQGVLAKSGICFSFAVGPYVSFRTLGCIELIPPLLAAITFPWCPESPYYLLGKKKNEEARASLVKLRGHTEVEDDYNHIEEAIRRDEENPVTFRFLLSNRNRPGLIICFGLSYFIVMTGTEAMLSFVQTILKEVKAPLSSKSGSLVAGSVLVTSALVATLLVDRVGRRPLLLTSAVLLFACNLTIAIFFVLVHNSVGFSEAAWVPLMAVLLYVVAYGVGLATVAFAVIGEVMPKNLKAYGGVLLGLSLSFSSMAMGKLFQVVSDRWGYYVIFTVFTINSAGLFPFVWWCIPETKGRTLNEILDILEKKYSYTKEANDNYKINNEF